MRKIIIFCLVYTFCLVSVFADDEVTSDSAIEPEIITQSTDLGTVNVSIDNSGIASAITDLSSRLDNFQVSDIEPSEMRLMSVNVSSERISADDANGFKAVVLDLIGDYETIITDYTYQSGSSGYYSHSIDITPDWSWISSASIFLVVVYCAFRLVGGMLCNR